jgi:hypothetical protein
MANPQIPLTGNIGAGGIFPLVNSPSVVFATDADHTMMYPDMSGSSGFIRVTSDVSLTATRNLIAPMVTGFMWAIQNATTGGHTIQVIGLTGAGVPIPSGYTMPVFFDGTNYVTTPSASGGTVLSVTATAPVASTAGTNPVISMAQATAIVNGWLSSADWATFNGKQNALGYVPAHSGANSDITSLTGLTTPLSTGQGGSGTAGGTGYRYGNGASPDSYSPTIPASAISGGSTAQQVILVPPTLISTLTTATTVYVSPYGISANAITTNQNYRMPLAGTATQLYVGTQVAIPSGRTIVVTLEDNTTDTALTCTLSADAQATDLTHSVSIAAGDSIQFKVVTNGDVSTGEWLTIGFVYGNTITP